MSTCSMRRTATEAASTRETLLEAAVPFFAEHGYAGASLEDLAAQLGVTRGAVYHHFGSKQGLFAAVVETLMARLEAEIVATAEGAPDLWAGMHAGCEAF